MQFPAIMNAMKLEEPKRLKSLMLLLSLLRLEVWFPGSDLLVMRLIRSRDDNKSRGIFSMCFSENY